MPVEHGAKARVSEGATKQALSSFRPNPQTPLPTPPQGYPVYLTECDAGRNTAGVPNGFIRARMGETGSWSLGGGAGLGVGGQ